MKRKFYLLALICAVAGTSVISSCKDTDEDLYLDLKNQLAQSDKNYQDLKKAIDELKSGILNGKDGVDGKDGVNGKNAVEVWLDENPGKTEADFWESLKGKDGKDGKDASIDDLLEALKAYETKEEHQADMDYILDLIEKLKKDLVSLDVAGVIIQNVYNPAFGYASLPLGIQTNVLTAYYSTETNSAKFPAVEAIDNGLTDDELKAIGFTAKSYDLTDLNIKAGKVYLTVNPSNVDFAGKVPTIVNSKGEADGITLTKLEACDETLYFGYTRAASNLYVADAVVSDFGATEQIHLNTKENAKQIKEAIKGEGTNATKIVKVAYELLNNVCQRKAIQIANEKSTVTSEYSLAAALVKPLGFKTLEAVCDSKYMDKLKEVTSPTTGKKPIDQVLTEAQKAIDDLYPASMPAIIAEGEDGSCLLSVSSSAPTSIASSVKLHAVSFCGETLVPYAMKHVAVVKVTGAADNDAAMADANNTIHMNCIVNHGELKDYVIDLAGLVSGATYELVYSAMDYKGDVVAQRMYFTVK